MSTQGDDPTLEQKKKAKIYSQTIDLIKTKERSRI